MSDFIYDLLHIVPLSLIGVLIPDFSAPEAHLYVCTILCDLLCLVCHYQKPKIHMMILGSLLVLAGSFCILNGIPYQHAWMAQTLIICLLCLIIEKISKRYRAFRSATALLMAAFIIVAAVFGMPLKKTAFLMVFLYLLTAFAEAIQLFWKKQGDTAAERHVVYIAPFLLVIILIMFGIRFPEKPCDWSFAINAVRQIGFRLESIGDRLDAGKSEKEESFYIGFSDDAILRGNLNIVSYKVIDAFSDVYDVAGMNIGGKTFDRFEDLEWKKSDDSDLDYRTYDLLETMAALMEYDKENTVDYFRNAFVNVECVGIRSEHLFMPLKSLPYIDRVPTLQKGGDVLFEDRISSTYKVRFYRLKRDIPDIGTLIAGRKAMNAEELEAALDKTGIEDREAYTIEGYDAYRRKIEEIYAEPVNVSDRTRELLDALLKGAESDYEKLFRIEEYLSSMEYDLKPGKLPKDIETAADFLDYQLFERKKGYCVHYATAFVLLARAEGIPARYVQGYRFPINTGSAEIRSDNAHAWPEAYLEGFGWLEFEPTPNTGSNNTASDGSQTQPQSDLQQDTGIKTDVTEEEKKSDPIKVYLPLLAAVSFLVVCVLIDRYIRKYRFSRMDEQEKMRLLFRRNLKMLKWLGCGMEKDETLSEFAQRIKEDFPADIGESIAVYEEAIYGRRKVNEADLALFTKAGEILRGRCLDLVLSKLKKKHRKS